MRVAPTVSDTTIAVTTATAMYLLLKLTMVTILPGPECGLLICEASYPRGSGGNYIRQRQTPRYVDYYRSVVPVWRALRRNLKPAKNAQFRWGRIPAMPQVPEFTLAELTGRARTHLAELKDPPVQLHKEVVVPFQAMRAAATADGIDLVAFSGFRDFDRQLAIWNGKFRGERPMQDRDGAPLDALSLPPARRVEAICWWSALPGASRHHWGTDFDVMDRAALPAGYKFQVVPA